MNRALIGALSCALFLSACDQQAPSEPTNESTKMAAAQTPTKDQNQAFEQFEAAFLDKLWQLQPDFGVYQGFYGYDDRLVVPNAEQEKLQQQFEAAMIQQLQTFDPAALSALNATDWAMLQNQLESMRWYRESFRSGEWDPSQYNVADVFALLLGTEYKPLDERLRTLYKRLENVPAYYQAAMANIKIPTLAHTDLAIDQNRGALGVFTESIPQSLQKSSLSDAEKAAFQPRLDAAVNAINEYVAWLEQKRKQINDSGAKDFRIGEALYEQKFHYDIVSDYSAKELYQKALDAKQKLHEKMIEITQQLWPKYFDQQPMPQDQLLAVKQLIDKLSTNHIDRVHFVDEVKRQMPIIRQFIVDHDLLDMDPSRPLVVRETPEYMRGIAGASVNAPGPFDATANTYYNVTPLDDYSDERAESYLREYNHWILQVLNIHEALPGHYAQLVHANKSPSKIKAIFGNGAMIEGWAVYSERMMLEQGYANNEPEMWLMYSKWNLRVVVNTILDYSVHVLGMNKEQALDLLMNQAFQEKAEAEGKWRRVSVSQVQLTSYFDGFSEIYALREELKQKLGEQFDLKSFHNKFLSYGSAPVPVIRRLMLADLGLK